MYTRRKAAQVSLLSTCLGAPTSISPVSKMWQWLSPPPLYNAQGRAARGLAQVSGHQCTGVQVFLWASCLFARTIVGVALEICVEVEKIKALSYDMAIGGCQHPQRRGEQRSTAIAPACRGPKRWISLPCTLERPVPRCVLRGANHLMYCCRGGAGIRKRARSIGELEIHCAHLRNTPLRYADTGIDEAREMTSGPALAKDCSNQLLSAYIAAEAAPTERYTTYNELARQTHAHSHAAGDGSSR